MDDIVYRLVHLEMIDDGNKVILHLLDCMHTRNEVVPTKEFEYYLERTLAAFEKC